jgi:hypothetical protein
MGHRAASVVPVGRITTLAEVRSSDAALQGAFRERLLAWWRGASPGAVVLAATLPVVFLHVDYQPSLSLPLGATFKLSDAMVLLTAVAALAAAAGGGLRHLRPGLAVWLTGLLFLAWVLAATFYPLLSSRPYAWRTHLVTAGEFWEYALLAPAVPLLVRRRHDVRLVLGTLVVWGMIAVAVGLVQWAGWTGLAGWGRGLRQPSFVGTHELTGLGGMLIGIGTVALLWHGDARRLALAARATLVIGLVGFVLGGASAGIVGLVPAAVAAVAIAARRGLVARRSLAAALAATVVASVGVVALRAGDFTQFLRFLGLGHEQASASRNIQTYSQRTLLAYVGVRIWLHHPVLGVGWQGSSEPSAFGPELPAAHARFPHEAAIAIPSARHAYGVQILYVQVLADLGVVGLLLLVALLLAAGALAARAALRAPPLTAFVVTLGLFWLLLALGLWSALGLVAGVPLDALTWLALGLVCTRGVEA